MEEVTEESARLQRVTPPYVRKDAARECRRAVEEYVSRYRLRLDEALDLWELVLAAYLEGKRRNN